MKKIIGMLLLLASISSFGQSLYRRAEKSYARFEFATAASLYERILKKNPTDYIAKARLAQCHKSLKSGMDRRGQSANRQNRPNSIAR